MAKNMLIGQSGGPTVAINSSLAGAVRAAMGSAEIGEIYGALNGLEGILQRRLIDLREQLPTPESIDALVRTPSMALGTCRLRLPAQPDETYQKVADIFEEYGIGYFFYIGGNDSMDTVRKLSIYFAKQGRDIQCVGIPKTVDNDLMGIDHTPGFASAAKFIATTVREIDRDTGSYANKSVTVVEVMGRNAGWLTASAAMARTKPGDGPHLLYLPEVPFDEDVFIEQIIHLQHSVNNVIVAVSEGVRKCDGQYIGVGEGVDAFGHPNLGGVGRYLESLVRAKIGCKVRSVEFGVTQRAAAHISSDVDIAEGQRLGEYAVELALAGQTGVMAAHERVSNDPYETRCICLPVEKVANLERKVPPEWIRGGCDVTDDMIRYLRPLLGENGLPDHFRFSWESLAQPAAVK